MRIHSFRSLLRVGLPRSWFKQAPRPRRKHGSPPLLETLEDRSLPSTFTVLNTNDAGAGSLRQAVLEANESPGSDVIEFAPDLSGTITLLSGQLAVTDELTIAGPGADRLAVSGNDVSRVFEIADGTSAIIAGLTVSHGRAVDGAGIRNAGILTVVQSVLTENQAVSAPGDPRGDARGGGIFNANGAMLVLDQTTLVDNLAIGNPSPGAANLPGAKGGGLYNEGNAAIDQVTFRRNRATTVAGGDVVGGRGGAIWNGHVDAPPTFPAVLAINDSTLADNQALAGDGLQTTGGRALGGAIFSRHGFVSINSSMLNGNQALAATSAPGFGGNFGGGGAIANTTVGGILSSLLISNSTVSDSLTVGGAGGGNGVGGTGSGGAIYNESALTILGSTLSGNRAVGGAGAGNGFGGSGFGGVITNVVNGNVFISQSMLTGNQAVGGAGGAGGANGAGGFGVGGVISTGAPNRIHIVQSTLTENQALGGAGIVGGGAQGGAIQFTGGLGCVEDSVITGNQALGGASTTGGASGQGIGGGVFISGGVLGIVRTTIMDNMASTSNNDVFGTFSEQCPF